MDRIRKISLKSSISLENEIRMKSVLIVAGENSGEKYGASFIREFKKKHPQVQFFGIGGKAMEAAGLKKIFSLQDLNVVGMVEIAYHFPRILKIFHRLKKITREKQPDAAVLINSPDFNLRLARFLKKMGIPVLYYVSPTVWAWREGRLKTIKKNVTKMLLIFPFEEKVYKDNHIPAIYIGHPLQEEIRLNLSRHQFFQKYGLDPAKNLISFLPGSRLSEIKNHLPVLTETLHLLHGSLPVESLFLLAENLEKDYLQEFLPSWFPSSRILSKDHYEAMAYSDLVLSSCGIANLEAALLEAPLIVFYRISPLSYKLGIRFMKITNFSIVNILTEEKIITELIQNNFTGENLFSEAKYLLENPERRQQLKAQLQVVKSIMGENKASIEAALQLEKILNLDHS